MLTCKNCPDESFEDEDAAKEHVQSVHSDVCDDKLAEYISDSVQDAYEDLIEEE